MHDHSHAGEMKVSGRRLRYGHDGGVQGPFPRVSYVKTVSPRSFFDMLERCVSFPEMGGLDVILGEDVFPSPLTQGDSRGTPGREVIRRHKPGPLWGLSYTYTAHKKTMAY